jgi:hypothetical protein
MSDLYNTLPLILHTFYVISENRPILDSYLFRIFDFSGAADPMRLFMSIMVQQMTGISYQSHYNEVYPEIKICFSSYFSLYCGDRIRETVSKINNSMAAWKLLLFQSFLVKNRCPRIITPSDGETVADIDVTTIQSSSSEKEGAESGYNKKAKGKNCFQLSATFIGKIFVDAKLFPGCSNPKDFFQKAVMRVISLGFAVAIVRADCAYMTLENLLFLTKLSLGYALGTPVTFKAVKEGIELFKKAARKNSSAIIRAAKGIAILDLGWITLSGGVRTRIIIVRRINRKRKKGKWQINTYYYAIASNLPVSASELYAFYHKRQCIEAGFRELKQHYNLERLPFRSLKANEFWIICKIIAMTLFKIFQAETLSKVLRRFLRKTFLRKVLQNGLCSDESGKVQAVPKSRYTWHLRRLICKIERMNPAYNY